MEEQTRMAPQVHGGAEEHKMVPKMAPLYMGSKTKTCAAPAVYCWPHPNRNNRAMCGTSKTWKGLYSCYAGNLRHHAHWIYVHRPFGRVLQSWTTKAYGPLPHHRSNKHSNTTPQGDAGATLKGAQNTRAIAGLVRGLKPELSHLYKRAFGNTLPLKNRGRVTCEKEQHRRIDCPRLHAGSLPRWRPQQGWAGDSPSPSRSHPRPWPKNSMAAEKKIFSVWY